MRDAFNHTKMETCADVWTNIYVQNLFVCVQLCVCLIVFICTCSWFMMQPKTPHRPSPVQQQHGKMTVSIASNCIRSSGTHLAGDRMIKQTFFSHPITWLTREKETLRDQKLLGEESFNLWLFIVK